MIVHKEIRINSCLVCCNQFPAGHIPRADGCVRGGGGAPRLRCLQHPAELHRRLGRLRIQDQGYYSGIRWTGDIQHCTALRALHYSALACTTVHWPALHCCVVFSSRSSATLATTGWPWSLTGCRSPGQVTESACKFYDEKVSHKIYFNCSLNLPLIP